METDRNRTLILVIVAAVALLIGCCCGIVLGAAGASLIGVRSLETSEFVPPVIEEFGPLSPERPELIEPERIAPELPDMQGLSGAFVREIAPGSPADEAGLLSGDLITSVDGIPLDANHTLADLIAGYEPGDRIELEVVRDAGAESLRVTLGENADNPGRAYLGILYMDVQK